MHFADCSDSNVCTVLNNELHNRTRKLISKRYRFVLQVILAEKCDHDVQIASRWLWNENHDGHCTVNVETPTMNATVIFHTLYME